MEKRGSRSSQSTKILMIIWLMSLLSVSCQQKPYLELLTGGDMKYWKFPEYPLYLTFNKKTQRMLYYDENFKESYMNVQDFISKGQFFRIKGDTIFRSWVFDTYHDTIPVDTLMIVSISSKRLVLRFCKDCGGVKLIHYSPKKRKSEF